MNSTVLTPNINCDVRKIKMISHFYGLLPTISDFDKYKSLTASIINLVYNRSILEKMKIREIIICKAIKSKKQSMDGISCVHNNIVALSVDDYRGFAHTLHHEIMHHILAFGLNNLIDKEEMKSNFRYVGRFYEDYKRHPNFVSTYARFDLEEDICETYAFLMIKFTTDFKMNIIINKVIAKKMAIILNALKQYDKTFYRRLIKNINIDIHQDYVNEQILKHIL